MLALFRFKERVPEEPPTTFPKVPEYESDEPIVGVEVATVCRAPVPAPYMSCPDASEV